MVLKDILKRLWEGYGNIVVYGIILAFGTVQFIGDFEPLVENALRGFGFGSGDLIQVSVSAVWFGFCLFLADHVKRRHPEVAWVPSEFGEKRN